MKRTKKTKPLLPYSTLDSISNNIDNIPNYHIVVRLLHIWEARDFKTNNVLLSFECLLLDEKDCTIQASILPHRIHKFKEDLVEGQLFSITDFDVELATNRYRRSNHSCKLLFTENTVLDDVKDEQCDVGKESFRMFTYSEMFLMMDKGEDLPDVVAQIATFKAADKKSKENPSKTSLNLILTCTLDSGDTAYISLWEDLASTSLTKLTNHANQPVLLIATHLNPRKFMGNLYLNGTASTKLIYYRRLISYGMGESKV
ncbi:hypothetical protein AALP_AA5G178700 [Arabis alpina]|uniref:Replication protein A 70 kDa DNA-binding subunit B/D first OB fold domain-containing protein n=1 Tax=Arabis alpina TaxID=50452 RepID=A0A087GXT6_ARAAL|nr:hypothetical protein AALP_AA5G178700 [Arabis alpina]